MITNNFGKQFLVIAFAVLLIVFSANAQETQIESSAVIDELKGKLGNSRSADFFAGDVIRGISTFDGKNWYSKIRKTGDYYIYVTAHPVANYTLKVSAK